MAKYLKLFFVGVCTLLLFAGCSFSEKTPLDPLNYTTYVNKEITLVLNNLESCMANATLVNEANVDDELTNIDQSLVLIQEAIESVKGFTPPNEYGNDHLMVVQRMQDCYDSLYQYRSYLSTKNFTYIDDYVDDMQMKFSSLKAMFNNMNN